MDRLWTDPSSTLTQWQTPLFQDTEIVELPVDQRTITRRYTQKAIDFVTTHRDQPFFIYLPHSMPHIPLYVPDDVRDPNPLNAYTNTIEHIDAEIGRLLTTLDDLGLAQNTLVIFTSDNGPWLPFKHHGGSAGPLREGKGTTFEGGQRVPFLIRGPGIPASTTCPELIGSIDVLPSIAALIGSPLPSGKKIDGLDVSALWKGEVETSPRSEFLYYTAQGELEGIRQGPWKLLVKQPNTAGKKGKATQAAKATKAPPAAPTLLLFDLAHDLGEQTNLADAQPERLAELRARMAQLDAEITQNARSPWFKP
jgi:arylsulfatase A-like enzyme